jgi:type II secretory ATPase GspE/PulE/Tfp pilus assembly ATPase PilB-like protein
MNGDSNSESFATTYPNVSSALALYGVEVKKLSFSYPRIVKIIDATWGSADCFHYLDSLLFSERPDRQGFPTDVLDEIVFIKNIFEFSYPQFASSRSDPLNKSKMEEIQEHIKEVASSLKREQGLVEESSNTKSKTRTLNESKDKSDVTSHLSLRNCITMMECNTFPKGRKRELIGQYLIECAAISESILKDALNLQSKLRTRHLLGDILIADHSITFAQLNFALCQQRGVPTVDVSSLEISPEAVRLIPLRIAQAKNAMPIMVYDGRIVVAVDYPFNTELQRYFSFLSGLRAILVYSSEEQIMEALNSYSESNGRNFQHSELNGRVKNTHAPQEHFKSKFLAPNQQSTLHNQTHKMGSSLNYEVEDDLFDEGELEDNTNVISQQKSVDENDETVIGLINKTINDAIRYGASDIHYEAFPRTRNAQIRFRKDGKLEINSTYPISFHTAVVSRLKIMAALDISEKRKSQDGKISFTSANKKLDLRVSTIPTSNFLEIVTVRILNSGKPLALSKIGMHPEILEAFRQQINKPHGLILVCGPTGSGKTTTLHSVLRELNTDDRKIWTAEDPVEIVQKNISQVQVLPKIGWTFEKALRSFLRADPDIIMVGEIRDSETAKVAVEASMTGHLVLSTLHTNSAAETLTRMIDLEVPTFNLADATQAILSQRLARKVCVDCSERFEYNSESLDQLVMEYNLSIGEYNFSKQDRAKLVARWMSEFGENGHLHGQHGVGCPACHGTGYRGRIGIHELLLVTPELRHLITTGASTMDIFKYSVKQGMKTLRQDAIEKILQGLTDINEVRMVCM